MRAIAILLLISAPVAAQDVAQRHALGVRKGDPQGGDSSIRVLPINVPPPYRRIETRLNNRIENRIGRFAGLRSFTAADYNQNISDQASRRVR